MLLVIENNSIKYTIVALCSTLVGHFFLVNLQTDSARLTIVYNQLNHARCFELLCVCVCVYQCMCNDCVRVRADTTLSEYLKAVLCLSVTLA